MAIFVTLSIEGYIWTGFAILANKRCSIFVKLAHTASLAMLRSHVLVRSGRQNAENDMLTGMQTQLFRHAAPISKGMCKPNSANHKLKVMEVTIVNALAASEAVHWCRGLSVVMVCLKI